jgi:peptide-methionine (S)-S-oxide reductase
MEKIKLTLVLFVALIVTANAQKKTTMSDKTKGGLSVATFGAGCFWCTEAVFLSVKGVEKVESG